MSDNVFQFLKRAMRIVFVKHAVNTSLYARMFLPETYGLPKTILIALILGIGWSGCVRAKPVLDIQHWQTNNGAQVYFVNASEIPMVQINVVFAAGSARDGDKFGIAQLTSAMLNQGTKNLTDNQIAEKFDAVGAQYDASANRDMGIVSLQSLTDANYLNPAVQTFSEVLTQPSFPEVPFKRTQQQTLSMIQQQQQIPSTVAKNAFFAAVYDKNPYAHPILGETKSVTALTPQDLLDFFKKYYVAKNAIVTIVGAVNRQQAEALANQIMTDLPAGEAASPLSVAPQVTQAVEERIKFPSEQTNILMGQVGINYQDPNYFPFMVGNYMLGSSPLTSRLFNEVREKRGLAYSVGSIFVPLQAKGPFLVVLQTRNGEAEQSLKVVNETLNNFLKAAPPADELAATQRKIINSFPLSLAGNDNISNNLVTIGFYHLPLNYLDTYRNNIAAVTAPQVQQTFLQTVYPDKMVTVMVGKTKSN